MNSPCLTSSSGWHCTHRYGMEGYLVRCLIIDSFKHVQFSLQSPVRSWSESKKRCPTPSGQLAPSVCQIAGHVPHPCRCVYENSNLISNIPHLKHMINVEDSNMHAICLDRPDSDGISSWT